MRIGTANIKNFPDMTPEQVTSDAKKIADYVTIFGAQEIQGRDSSDVLSGLNQRSARVNGGAWGVILPRYETPIFYRTDLWRAEDISYLEIPNRDKFNLTARNSAIVGAVFDSRTQDGLPQFAVVNCHLITDGITGEGAIDRRLVQWGLEFDLWTELVDYYFQKGITVFPLGDTNNQETKFPAKNGRWLTDFELPRIDKVGVRQHPGEYGSEFKLNDSFRVNLNSDHDLLLVEGSLKANG